MKGYPSDNSAESAERYSERLSDDDRFQLHSGALYSEERLLEDTRARLKITKNSPKNILKGVNPIMSV